MSRTIAAVKPSATPLMPQTAVTKKRFFTATHVQGPGTGTSLVSGIPAELFFPEHPPTEETR